MSNMKMWDKVSKPPATALKQITGGRMSGKTDIKPQWRLQVMTEVYGLCGFGWRYTIDRLWLEDGCDAQVMAFANISLYIKVDNEWSEAIPGHGGNMLTEKERGGLHSSDEAWKMAITDALSVAMKQIGVASEIYMGNWDGSKYRDSSATRQATQPPQRHAEHPPASGPDAEYQQRIKTALHTIFGADKKAALDKVEELTSFVPKGKEEADRVKGVRDFTKLTGQRLSILAHSLERLVPKQDAPEICNECHQPTVNGACRNLSCPEGRPE